MHGCRKRRRPDLAKLGQKPMRQTWSSPVQKIDAPTEPPPDEGVWKWLLDMAATFEAPLRKAFMKALQRARESMDMEALERALADQDVEAAMRELNVDELMRTTMAEEVAPQVEDIFVRVGGEAPGRTLGASIGMRFDLRNPKTEEFLRDYNLDLIKDISDQTRDGIRQVLQDAFRMGGHPYVQARLIRDSLGLTDTQEAAVDNFRTMLENGDRLALTRALRDRRHDRTLDQALGAARRRELSPDQIDTMVGRYRQRMISARATTIARTETIRAANAAQTMAWQQAAEHGFLDGQTARRFWFVTPDDRACEICEAIPDDNEEGVPLDGTFDTELGPVAFPPAHPNCRCATFIRAVPQESGDAGDNGGPKVEAEYQPDEDAE